MGKFVKIALTVILLCIFCILPFGIAPDQSVQPQQAVLAGISYASHHYDAVLKESTSTVSSPMSVFIFFGLLFAFVRLLFSSRLWLPYLYSFAAMAMKRLLLFPLKFKSRYVALPLLF